MHIFSSFGITARVFKDLGKLQTKESQIVLCAAVIDDILGFIILAVVSAIVTIGTVTPSTVLFIIGKAAVFLVAAIVLGQYLAPFIGRFFSRIQEGVGMKFTLAFSFGLIFAYVAQQIGLAPVLGAFAAGLILDQVTFKAFKKPEVGEELEDVCNSCDKDTREKLEHIIRGQSHKHIETLIEPVAFLWCRYSLC